MSSSASINSTITIEFRHLKSPNHVRAIEECQKIETYETVDTEGEIYHRVTIPANETSRISSLIGFLWNCRSRNVLLDGTPQIWYKFFNYNYCHTNQKSALESEKYCFGHRQPHLHNLWGCKFASVPGIGTSFWWYIGRPGPAPGDWTFDKDRIRVELENALFQQRFCPAMDFSRINCVLESIPETVNPNNDKTWAYVFERPKAGLVSTSSSSTEVSLNDDYFGARPLSYDFLNNAVALPLAGLAKVLESLEDDTYEARVVSPSKPTFNLTKAQGDRLREFVISHDIYRFKFDDGEKVSQVLADFTPDLADNRSNWSQYAMMLFVVGKCYFLSEKFPEAKKHLSLAVETGNLPERQGKQAAKILTTIGSTE